MSIRGGDKEGKGREEEEEEENRVLYLLFCCVEKRNEFGVRRRTNSYENYGIFYYSIFIFFAEFLPK